MSTSIYIIVANIREGQSSSTDCTAISYTAYTDLTLATNEIPAYVTQLRQLYGQDAIIHAHVRELALTSLPLMKVFAETSFTPPTIQAQP